MNNTPSTIVTERVDDIPLLLNHMIQMGIPIKIGMNIA